MDIEEDLTTQEASEPTMDDTILAALEDMDLSEINRDEKGRFAKKAEEATAEVLDTTPTAEPEAVETPVIKPPSSLRKEVQEKWATLDPIVREEIEKREADFHKGIDGYRTKAQEAEAWNQAIQPYMQTINSFGVTPQVAVQNLFKADHTLRYGSPIQKIQFFSKLMNDYGIDKSQLGIPEVTQDSALSPLYQTVQSLEQKLLQREQLEAQREQLHYQKEIETLNSEVENFKKDKEHFETVKEDMARLLEAGASPDLSTLYETACWSNPATRPLMIAKQLEAERAKSTQKAQEAKKMGSVNVVKKGTLPANSKGKSTMDDTIRESLEELGIFAR